MLGLILVRRRGRPCPSLCLKKEEGRLLVNYFDIYLEMAENKKGGQ